MARQQGFFHACGFLSGSGIVVHPDPFNVEAPGGRRNELPITITLPPSGRLDTSKGTGGGAPPGFDFISQGNGMHGVKEISSLGTNPKTHALGLAWGSRD